MENTEKKEVVIYAYGYCNNAGAGSWISYLEYNGFRKKIEGQVLNTDKNRMELTSMVEALKSLKEPCIVTLYSNSQYCVNAISKGWAKKWAFNNWMLTLKNLSDNDIQISATAIVRDVEKAEHVTVKNALAYNDVFSAKPIKAIKIESGILVFDV